MSNTGWIKLRRSLIDWEWYDDHKATRLLIHLLITVNYEEKKWKGITINPGQMVLSWDSLSNAIGLSVKQCRTAMKKLEDSGEVARKVTNKYQLVTLVKWDKIQYDHIQDDKQKGRQKADKGQAKGRQRATTKERKEYKEGKEDIIIKKGDENGVLISVEKCKEKYLSDERTVEAVCSNPKNKLTKETIANRLDEFNTHLTELGAHFKEYHKYCAHFKNWHLKNHKEKPASFEEYRKQLHKSQGSYV